MKRKMRNPGYTTHWKELMTMEVA
ncbi:DUF4113 domain-containing protein [Glutamicibacter sp.]